MGILSQPKGTAVGDLSGMYYARLNYGTEI